MSEQTPYQTPLVDRLKRGFGSAAGYKAQVAAYDRVCREAAAHIIKIEAQRDDLLDRFKFLLEVTEQPPEPNCSCHICPPCSDCMDNSGLRAAIKDATESIAKVEVRS